MSTPGAQILVCKYHLPLKGTQASYGKQLTPGLGQEEYQVGLEHLLCHKKQTVTQKLTGTYQQETGATLRGSHW